MKPIPLPQVPLAQRQKNEKDMLEARRRMECSARTQADSCLIIDQILGWVHGLPLSQCDICQEMGNFTDEAEKWREGQAQEIVKFFSQPHIMKRGRRAMLAALFSKHLTPEQTQELMKDPEIQFAMEREKVWSEVKKSWEEADREEKLGVAEFGQAMLSRGLGNKRVDDDTLNTRTISCTGKTLDGKTVAPPCPSLTTGRDQSFYCGACGCPQSHLSRISGEGYTKLHYPTLSCPRKRPGFHNSVAQPAESGGSETGQLPQ